MTSGFGSLLARRWASADSMLCVGLDPDPARLPGGMRGDPGAVADFCIAVVDAVAHLVCAFKPQIAHFAAIGAEDQLERLCSHVREHHPEVPIILDAKRGDIGDTAAHYATEAFDRYGAHAVTVNPWMGSDSLEPFLARTGRGVVVLCRTSNPGAGEFQDLEVDGEPLYLRVARTARDVWSKRTDVALVVGATFPEQLARVRRCAGDLPLLVPGVGAQGADAGSVVRNGIDSRGAGLVVNASRAVLYPDGAGPTASVEDHLSAVVVAAERLRTELASARP
jgi:orotidine-5'-phosphate decarboxylase